MEIFRYAIATLLIILGFIALIVQKVYINPENPQVSEIHLPLLGKLKTNYPSVVFVFIAAALILIPPNKIQGSDEKLNEWNIAGKLTSSIDDINWKETEFIIHPSDVSFDIEDDGMYVLTIDDVPESVDIEKIARWIYIKHPKLETFKINTDQEIKRWKNDDIESIVASFKRDQQYGDFREIQLLPKGN